MQSSAKTPSEYLSSLPADRRTAIEAVRKVILKNLPKGFTEIMQYGMISYVVPLSIYPPGYHCTPNTPLPFISLASQKNYMSLYLMGVYGNEDVRTWFEKEYKATGKKLEMGKSCLKFKKVEDLALDVIGKLMKKVSVKEYVRGYEKGLKKK